MMNRAAFDALQADVLADGDYLLDMIANAPAVAAIAEGTVEELLEVLADDIAAHATALQFLSMVEPLVSD